MPFFSKRSCGALFSECLEMPEARLQGSCWYSISRSWLLGCHVGPLMQGHRHLGDFSWINDINGTVCALPEGERMVSVLILIDDLKTDGAGRIECDVVPQVYKNSHFVLCLSRCRPWSSKLYVYSQSMNVISWFTLFKLFRYLKWDNSVSVCNTSMRVLLALSSWNWCTGWCVLFFCNCVIQPCLWLHTTE